MAYIVEPSTDHQYFPDCRFTDTPEAWMKLWRPKPDVLFSSVRTTKGYRVAENLLPTTVALHESRARLPDFFSIGGNFCVSTAFREIIEANEPGVHQFAPLIIKRQDHGHIEGDYWMFIICNVVDSAIIPERSTVIKKGGDSPSWYYALKAGRTIVLNKEKISSLHIWADRRYTATFFSDHIVAILDDAKMIGFVERRYIEEVA